MKLSLLACLLLIGCGNRHARQSGVNYFVGQECHTEALMKDCDPHTEPPVCKKIRLTFDKGCERVKVK